MAEAKAHYSKGSYRNALRAANAGIAIPISAELLEQLEPDSNLATASFLGSLRRVRAQANVKLGNFNGAEEELLSLIDRKHPIITRDATLALSELYSKQNKPGAAVNELMELIPGRYEFDETKSPVETAKDSLVGSEFAQGVFGKGDFSVYMGEAKKPNMFDLMDVRNALNSILEDNHGSPEALQGILFMQRYKQTSKHTIELIKRQLNEGYGERAAELARLILSDTSKKPL